jgi:DNA-binding MarR family transcriptional regulator
MTPENSRDLETVYLAVIPQANLTDVTQVSPPATFREPEITCQLPALSASDLSIPEVRIAEFETIPGSFSTQVEQLEVEHGEFERGEIENSAGTLKLAEQTVSTNSSSFESLIELVTEAADSVRELMTPCLTAHGLNDARFTIMRAIRGSKNGECSQSELARCMKQSEANVSTLLDRMRGDGLVSREKSPFDRRRSVVRLTDKGEQQLTVTEQEYSTRAQGVLRAFDVFEIQSFREQLSSFIAIWETELELVAATNAVAGRIGGNASDSHSAGTETRHAHAG